MTVSDIDYNAVASFERSKKPARGKLGSQVFTVALLAVFFIVLMTGLASGVSMYQAVAANQMDTNMARMQAGLLASNVHANDVANSIGTGNGPEGRALVLTEHATDGGAYEMRIYLYEGKIVQEYSVAGSAYTPERAQVLINSTTFDFELHGDLLVIFTDQGATNVALRSDQGGGR
ncbi:MAG TPA: DUF4860 domain-containing protein [Eggerthellaceae bacterium]|nr:DUF4860 domain-containing protein [Eggerthellaceae bacterium]